MKKNVLISVHGPIVDPSIDIELNEDQTINLDHLKNQTLTYELKRTFIREHLKIPVIILTF